MGIIGIHYDGSCLDVLRAGRRLWEVGKKLTSVSESAVTRAHKLERHLLLGRRTRAFLAPRTTENLTLGSFHS
jgi:hypothetical protein